MNDKIEDFVLNFLARKESPEDVQKLKEWLAEDPSRRDELKYLLAAWDSAGMQDVDHEAAYQRFIFRMNADVEAGLAPTPEIAHTPAPRVYNSFTTIYRIAAIFVVSFALGVLSHFYFSKDKPEQVAFIEKIVPLGSKSEINLPDGSSVSLNAGSTLRYPTDYGKIKRDIYLSGEGYFVVAKQEGKPFTVHTALKSITALGTEFNVKAYPDENMEETTLIKGEVIIKNSEEINIFEPAILKEGNKLSVTKSGSKLDVIITQLEKYEAAALISWKESNWYIESETLHELAVKLERRYNVTINIDEALKKYRFTGTIKDETLEQILNYMKLSAPIHFNVDGRNVNIQVDAEKMNNH